MRIVAFVAAYGAIAEVWLVASGRLNFNCGVVYVVAGLWLIAFSLLGKRIQPRPKTEIAARSVAGIWTDSSRAQRTAASGFTLIILGSIDALYGLGGRQLLPAILLSILGSGSLILLSRTLSDRHTTLKSLSPTFVTVAMIYVLGTILVALQLGVAQRISNGGTVPDEFGPSGIALLYLTAMLVVIALLSFSNRAFFRIRGSLASGALVLGVAVATELATKRNIYVGVLSAVAFVGAFVSSIQISDAVVSENSTSNVP